jgi:hypothetical protein
LLDIYKTPRESLFAFKEKSIERIGSEDKFGRKG